MNFKSTLTLMISLISVSAQAQLRNISQRGAKPVFTKTEKGVTTKAWAYQADGNGKWSPLSLMKVMGAEAACLQQQGKVLLQMGNTDSVLKDLKILGVKNIRLELLVDGNGKAGAPEADFDPATREIIVRPVLSGGCKTIAFNTMSTRLASKARQTEIAMDKDFNNATRVANSSAH
jgi:hypothetical protein